MHVFSIALCSSPQIPQIFCVVGDFTSCHLPHNHGIYTLLCGESVRLRWVFSVILSILFCCHSVIWLSACIDMRSRFYMFFVNFYSNSAWIVSASFFIEGVNKPSFKRENLVCCNFRPLQRVTYVLFTIVVASGSSFCSVIALAFLTQ